VSNGTFGEVWACDGAAPPLQPAWFATIAPEKDRNAQCLPQTLRTIRYFSIIGKDGEVLINVLQKQSDNPVRTAIPMLKANPVAGFSKKLKSMGGTEVLPQMVCPCTNGYFAISTDPFGNQMLIAFCNRTLFATEPRAYQALLEILVYQLLEAA